MYVYILIYRFLKNRLFNRNLFKIEVQLNYSVSGVQQSEIDYFLEQF